MQFNERLKCLRKRSPYKQREIAELIGVSTRTFQNYEHGDLDPPYKTLIKIADIFNVSLDYLVCRDFPLEANEESDT